MLSRPLIASEAVQELGEEVVVFEERDRTGVWLGSAEKNVYGILK